MLAAWAVLASLTACAPALTIPDVAHRAAHTPPAPAAADEEGIRWRSLYLDDWQPESSVHSNEWVADAVVAADGSGTHRSVQEAIDAQPSRGRGSAPGIAARRILIKPGRYAELVCVRDKGPLVLYGLGDPRETVITGNLHAAIPKAPGSAVHPCMPADAAAVVGTFASSTMIVHSHDVTLVGFTVANTAMDAVRNGQGYPDGAAESGGAQAVALTVRGDRVRLHRMRLLGHQDTFLADQRPGDRRHRVVVSHSMIAGDVDFIFGASRLVIEDSLIVSRSGRRAPGQGGYVLAPSTAHDEPYGFLVHRSRLLGQPGLAPQSIHLGRPWDAGVARGQWIPGRSPNGQALIRDSDLGAHLAGWARSTAWRQPDAQGAQAFRTNARDNRSSNEWAPAELP